MRRRLRLSASRLGADPIVIEGSALRHLRVLRLRPGDAVCLFDGEGGELEAELVEVGRERALARPGRRLAVDVEAPVSCWLVQAVPVRHQRMDLVVRQATELGVAGILPVLSRRGRAGGVERAWHRRVQRWRRIAASAAEQSLRTVVPRIDEPVELDGLDWEALPRPLLALDPGAGPGSLRRALASAGQRVTVMVGPEGGWDSRELQLAERRGAVPVALGPRVLRADSAGVVALAIVLHAWGDLG